MNLLKGFRRLWLPAILACMVSLVSCQDDLSVIGSSMTTGEVSITADSIEVSLDGRPVECASFDGRNVTKLLGRINVPEYGSLQCSFVAQLMAATSMTIPDSIPESDIDSIRLILAVPRGSLTGDSLAPQKLKVFRLNKELPKPIDSSFDPAGYFDADKPFGEAVYTLSNIAKGDSALKRQPYVKVPVSLPLDFGRELFRMYRNNDPVFQWPSTFNAWFPGIYVEQTFGNGCIANISNALVYTYWHRKVKQYEMLPDSTYGYVDYIRRDSVCLLGSQPEVLSSNIIRYKISDYLRGMAAEGNTIITTPGGYRVSISLPAQKLIDKYLAHSTSLQTVSSLRLEIPAEEIANDYGLTVAPYLLMVKTSELDEFFAENKVPDNKTSFYAPYNADKRAYSFGAMREYFISLLEKVGKGEALESEDIDFTLVPVNIVTETVEQYNTTLTTVTRCQPYLIRPTMTLLDTDHAIVSFIYSTQIID